MIDFFVLFAILFFTLLTGNVYYGFLIKVKPSNKEKNKKLNVKNSNKSLLFLIAIIFIILLITIIMNLSMIHLLTKNIFIVYMGTITFITLTMSLYAIQQNKNRLVYSILFSILLIGVQIYFKIPLLGGLLSTLGYIGAVNYVMSKKIVNPKIILFFLTIYMFYDFSSVFITPVQPALANKTLNNIFPSAIIFGKTILGLGDVSFTLIMTAFSRVYYGLKISILTAFLTSFPLVGLGLYSALVPYSEIAVPYLVLTTPFLLILVFILKQEGYKLK